jgi:hypothetical protein
LSYKLIRIAKDVTFGRHFLFLAAWCGDARAAKRENAYMLQETERRRRHPCLNDPRATLVAPENLPAKKKKTKQKNASGVARRRRQMHSAIPCLMLAP